MPSIYEDMLKDYQDYFDECQRGAKELTRLSEQHQRDLEKLAEMATALREYKEDHD